MTPAQGLLQPSYPEASSPTWMAELLTGGDSSGLPVGPSGRCTHRCRGTGRWQGRIHQVAAGEHGLLPHGCFQGVQWLCPDEFLARQPQGLILRRCQPSSLLSLSLMPSGGLGPWRQGCLSPQNPSFRAQAAYLCSPLSLPQPHLYCLSATPQPTHLLHGACLRACSAQSSPSSVPPALLSLRSRRSWPVRRCRWPG